MLIDGEPFDEEEESDESVELELPGDEEPENLVIDEGGEISNNNIEELDEETKELLDEYLEEAETEEKEKIENALPADYGKEEPTPAEEYDEKFSDDRFSEQSYEPGDGQAFLMNEEEGSVDFVSFEKDGKRYNIPEKALKRFIKRRKEEREDEE